MSVVTANGDIAMAVTEGPLSIPAVDILKRNEMTRKEKRHSGETSAGKSERKEQEKCMSYNLLPSPREVDRT